MTPRQIKFAEEYLKGISAEQAYINAGYDPNLASINALNVLQSEIIQNYIEFKRQDLKEKPELDASYVVTNLRTISDRCLQAVPVTKFDRISREHKHLIQDGCHVWQFDASAANKANELLGRYLGMFIDKLVIHDSTKTDFQAWLVSILNDCKPETRRDFEDVVFRHSQGSDTERTIEVE